MLQDKLSVTLDEDVFCAAPSLAVFHQAAALCNCMVLDEKHNRYD